MRHVILKDSLSTANAKRRFFEVQTNTGHCVVLPSLYLVPEELFLLRDAGGNSNIW